MRISLFFVWGAVILLVGCARHAAEPIVVYRMPLTQQWYGQKNWQLEGRLGVISTQDSFSATIHWRHGEDEDAIELAGPLGQGRVRLVVTPGQVVVDDGEHVQVYHQTAKNLMQAYFGVDLPLQALRFWLLGLVQPGVAFEEVESGFVQHGWRIVFRQMQNVDHAWLPRKINMEKESNKVKFIVDQWKIS